MSTGKEEADRWRPHHDDEQWPQEDDDGAGVVAALRRQWEAFSTDGPFGLLD